MYPTTYVIFCDRKNLESRPGDPSSFTFQLNRFGSEINKMNQNDSWVIGLKRLDLRGKFSLEDERYLLMKTGLTCVQMRVGERASSGEFVIPIPPDQGDGVVFYEPATVSYLPFNFTCSISFSLCNSDGKSLNLPEDTDVSFELLLKRK